MKRSNLFAFTLISGVLLAASLGCSNGPAPEIKTTPATPAGNAPPRPTPTQVAVVTPTAAPKASGTPGGSATPGGAAPAGAQADGFDKASAQPGFDDVKKIGKNPLFGDAGSIEKGKALFTQNCTSCHGDAGKGDGAAGVALDPKPRNLTAKAEYKYGTGDLALFRTIKYGSQGTGMAPWDGRMSDDECWQVVNYVKTIQGG